MIAIKPWDKKVSWNRVSNPEDLFRCILQRNKTQLLKALDSPFATGPLANQLERDGHGPATERILDGTLDITFINKVNQSAEMRNFILALKRPTNETTKAPVEELDYIINSESYRAIFSKAKESTASSPSGIHYGHYIAACKDDLLTAVNATL